MFLDVFAFGDHEYWICECKWWKEKVGVSVVKDFLALLEKVRDVKGRDLFVENGGPYTIKPWLFAHSGVTRPAEKMLLEHGILWSIRKELDMLIKEAGLRLLKDFTGDTETGPV